MPGCLCTKAGAKGESSGACSRSAYGLPQRAKGALPSRSAARSSAALTPSLSLFEIILGGEVEGNRAILGRKYIGEDIEEEEVPAGWYWKGEPKAVCYIRFFGAETWIIPKIITSRILSLLNRRLICATELGEALILPQRPYSAQVRRLDRYAV